MELWNEITSVDYIELTLDGEVVNAILLDGVRLDPTTVPSGFYMYHIRHSDFDWGKPSTVENHVVVNFFGTILVDHDLCIRDRDYINIEDWCFKDWMDVAEEELDARGIPVEYVEHWDNLAPISENIRKINDLANAEC